MRVFLALLLISTAALGADRAYRWVDGSGQVHYSEQRPARGDYQVIEHRTLAPAGAATAPTSTQKFLEDAAAGNRAQAEDKAKQQQARSESKAACDKARARLDYLDERTARRLSIENPDGTVARMDETEFEKRRASAQKDIDTQCR